MLCMTDASRKWDQAENCARNKGTVMAGYKLYDISGNEVTHKDLQQKQVWCKDGEDLENSFLQQYGERLNLKLNEAKHKNPTVPDFIDIRTNGYVDLKSQTTPFFQSRKYRVPPQYAVTLNKVDVDRYYKLYPEIIVLFHVKWIAVKMVNNYGTTEVDPIEGIWTANINEIKEMCKPENLHSYKQRHFDKNGNAKDSYVLDLNNSNFRYIKL